MKYGDPRLKKRMRQIRTDLAEIINKHIAEHGWSHKELCDQIGIYSADAHDIQSMTLKRFSMERLMMVLIILGRDPDVVVR